MGGGILGMAVAAELIRRGRDVVVFEKEAEFGTHQTGHNSGVVHAGIYYPPGSLKAELCRRGRTLLEEFCTTRDIPFQTVGKLVVAVDPSELARLDDLESRARANQVPGLRRLSSEEIAAVEPAAVGLAALHSPDTAITDFAAVTRALAADVVAGGGRALTSSPVLGLRSNPQGIEVVTPVGGVHVGDLVVCAGLQSDRVAKSLDGEEDPRIVPFRGEYMTVVASKQETVKGLIYPVPDPRYPFLGVHFHRLISGALEVGPNAVLGLSREAYRGQRPVVSDMVDFLSWPGFWRMAGRNWKAGLSELRGSMSKRAYMRRASRYVPSIGAEDVVPGRVGVRAQALSRDGSLVDDFRIYKGDGLVSVRNAPSPAATSSLAIAEHVVDELSGPTWT